MAGHAPTDNNSAVLAMPACDGPMFVAAVFDPNREELFTAERGQGARLNGKPLRVSASTSRIDSLPDSIATPLR